ncbi:MAG: lysophospholipid acyltransferase family protein [Acidobacteriota bacterium]
MKTPAIERIEYAIYLAFAMLIRLLPRSVLLRLGAFLGRVFYRIDRRHRELCRRNLHETLGPDSEKLAARVFEHFGRTALDSIKLWSMSPDRVRQLVDVVGFENMKSALDRGGVVLFTAHLGNWELGAWMTAIRFRPMVVITRALDNRLLERELRAKRERCGNEIVEKRESARPALKALRSGGIVAILIDQRVGPEEGLAGTFLGRPVYTTPAAARLALQTGAELVPAFCAPVGSGGRYRAVYLPPIPLTRESSKRPVEEIVQECNDVLSGIIRERPEHWLWMHDRWKPAN